MRLRNPFKPSPAPPAFGAGRTIPEVRALWPSRVILQWLSPFLRVGYSRPLETDDLWSLANEQLTEPLANQLDQCFYERCESAVRPKYLRGSQPVAAIHGKETEKASNEGDVEQVQVLEGTYDASVFKALCKAHRRDIIIAGLLNVVADSLQTVIPLVLRVFLDWLVASYMYHQLDEASRAAAGLEAPRGIGYGIGIAFGIFVMAEASSLMSNNSYKIAMAYGQSMRTALIGVLYRKSLRLSGKARTEHNTGQIITMISTDATNVEQFAGFAHYVWVAPVQIILGIGLLIGTLGYSALAGLGVIVIALPLEGLAVWVMYVQREKAIKITDKRVQLTSEVLQGIRLIKSYGWEAFFAQRISHLRGQEVHAIRKSAVALAGLFSLFETIPVLSAVVSFITFSLTGHDSDVGKIFSALQLFNTLRIPLLLLPLVFSNLSSAVIGCNRISKFLVSEDLGEPYLLEPASAFAVHAEGDFTWEAVRKPESKKDEKKDKKDNEKTADNSKSKNKSRSKDKKEDASVLPTTSTSSKDDGSIEENPFELKGLRFNAPKGALVAIVGRIGSGKSSLLQALMGEMKRTSGQVVVSGSLAYIPQTPWIQNTTLRNNITFGLAEDEERLREVIHCCGLEPDIAALPHGELTEIGERGINLSGGQKARISLARAAYSNSDIVLLDDPLSAVDAHVGRFIIENCLVNGPLASRTRILVTHALHVLDRTDYIYVMESGSIVEEGHYQDLMSLNGSFTRLIEDYGKLETNDKPQEGSPGKTTNTNVKMKEGEEADKEMKEAQEALMQLEERAVGAVDWKVYRTWLLFAGGLIWVPIVVFLLGTTEAMRVATNLWLSFWTSQQINGFKNWQYIAVYAGFGLAISLFTFVLAFAFFVGGLIASLRIFRAALNGILRSPVSFFDTTPMGRILSRFSKDQETLDNEVANVLYSFLSTFVSVFGVLTLVLYTFPYLGIAFIPLGILYYGASVYYRASSVEAKRLDSILRSVLYATISETLTGLSTVRAYGVQERSLQKAAEGLDVENRAYYMFIVLQRWLSLRLDFFGNILVLGIGLFSAGFRRSVNPADVGVVLTYTLSFTGIFSEMIAQFAQNEQNMNSVERVVHYTSLESEADLVTPNDPPPSWPTQGEIKFQAVELAYRPGLPLVLKGVNFCVQPREKIGIVGRTGAGKSSLIQALFRIVELSGGSIEIDGVDISKIGLNPLRSSLALVPQDNVLFLGTLRQNLDPQGTKTDAELLSALQRVSLLPPAGSTGVVADDKFSLDATVGDEGSNYSAGEKQLLALCRALVRNNRIIVLDEATSNVDVETDATVQRTIQTEFSSATLLCIAHRLNTIAFYDRVLVMSDGVVAEFDTVLNLYDKEDSIFRALCDEANLSRVDILRIREERAAHH